MNKEEFKNLKEGDLVQVKSLAEIHATLKQDGKEMVCNSFTGWSDSFVEDMEHMCGETVEVEEIDPRGKVLLEGGDCYNFLPEWLEVVK